jgi:hypothetical protein
MPTLKRTCFVCGRAVVLVSSSPGPYGIWAGMHGRALCDECAEGRIEKDRSGLDVVQWPDGDRMHRIGGVFIGAPCRNPEGKHCEPRKTSAQPPDSRDA